MDSIGVGIHQESMRNEPHSILAEPAVLFVRPLLFNQGANMKTKLALAAIASCLTFGASAQSFVDSFDNMTRLPQWSLSPTSSVIDAIGSDD